MFYPLNNGISTTISAAAGFLLSTVWRHLKLRFGCMKQKKNVHQHVFHGENAGTLGMVPLIINPIYTLYSGCLLGFMRYIPF